MITRLPSLFQNGLLHSRLYPRITAKRTVVYDLHNLTEPPPTSLELTKEDAIHLYKNMQYIRRMENTIASLYRSQKMFGFCHLYMGQEACAVGVRSVMRPKDTMITTYRGHGWNLLMGKDIQEGLVRIFSELISKKTGVSRAKGGSMHLYAESMYGGEGIVGTTGPIGTGLAFAHKYKGDGGIGFSIMGDAAVNQGQVHEAFNFAKLHNLPVIYVVENNLYGMGTPASHSTANLNLYTRGDLIPGIRMDGQDVVVVREAVKYAVDYVTSGKGPIILELLTYRYSGHSMSDPGTSYRTREEVERYKNERDPIKILAEKVISTDLVTPEELDEVKKEVKEVVANALKMADNCPDVDIQELTYDVYKESKGKVRVPAFGTYGDHRNMGIEPLPGKEKVANSEQL